MAAGEAHTVAIKTDGTLWAWGINGQGQLGLGASTGPKTCTFGNEAQACSTTPVQVGTASDWKTVAAFRFHTLALKTDGTLWAWGNDETGQLGVGRLGDVQNSPVQVGTASDWKTVAAGGWHTVALKTDGTLWAWGFNRRGELGLGTKIALEPCVTFYAVRGCSSAPVQVGTAFDWIAVTAGKDHSLAIKADGTLWTWGHWPAVGLGLNPQTAGLEEACHDPDQQNWCVYSPRQVGTDKWKAGSMGDHYTVAIKADGTLWSWGDTFWGKLGRGYIRDQIPDRPGQVGEASHWKTVALGWYHSLAIKTDGTLWAWGDNGRGQLGLGTSTGPQECTGRVPGPASPTEVHACSTSPVQVGADRDRWIAVAAGTYHTVAIKADGTLWAWGHNESGQLGLGDTTDRTTPEQVP